MGAIEDAAAQSPEDAATDRALVRAETAKAELRRERDSARAALKQSEKEREAIAADLALVQSIADLDPHPPKWLTPKRKASSHHATLCTILSDLHLDEVVNPAEVGGNNAYNRHVAEVRMRRTFDQIVRIARTQMAGVTFDGALVMLGGDLVSGSIHDELRETNEDSMPGTVLHWAEHLAAGLSMLADEFGKVHCPVVVGNHGRLTRKPRAKGRARDSWDWLLCQIVARVLAHDKRVTFDIPDSAHVYVQVYDHRYRLEHGDSARGGSGWMGVLGPAMRRDQKMRTVAQATGDAYDTLVIGHWHRLSWLPGVIVNGSTKGLDEYAAIEGFGFEPPQQALWLTTPEHGITMQAPIFCAASREDEGW